MEKVVYNTRFGKPIVVGQVYAAVLSDNSFEMRTAGAKDKKDPNVVERFLNKVGARNFLNKKGVANPIMRISDSTEAVVAAPYKAPEPVLTPEEIEENRIKALHFWKQLDSVTSEKDFKAWLKRNNITTSENSDTLKLIMSGSVIMSFGFKLRGVPSCCGGRELGTHTGSMVSPENFSEERMKILAKYIVDAFDRCLSIEGANYGIVSYVRDSGNIASSSGRIGFLHDASPVFHRVAKFINPNSKRELIMYTINDDWTDNED